MLNEAIFNSLLGEASPQHQSWDFQTHMGNPASHFYSYLLRFCR